MKTISKDLKVSQSTRHYLEAVAHLHNFCTSLEAAMAESGLKDSRDYLSHVYELEDIAATMMQEAIVSRLHEIDPEGVVETI